MHVSGFFLHYLSVFAATDLKHDVLLLHADSVVTNKFGLFVHRELTERSKLPYDVFHYSGDDVLFGESVYDPQIISLIRLSWAILTVSKSDLLNH